jgi:hypothetical protein
VVQKGVEVGFAFVEVAVQESLAVAQVVDWLVIALPLLQGSNTSSRVWQEEQVYYPNSPK